MSDNLKNQNERETFIKILQFILKKPNIESHLVSVFGIFKQNNMNRKFIKLNNVSEIISNKKNLLTLINLENNIILFESQAKNNNVSKIQSFIGIEIIIRKQLDYNTFLTDLKNNIS
uniref:Uncharacterized protein n=1 Tax=Pseudourostyla cristata TaxID=293816 RepID=A0A4P9JLQ3_9SPIT|nr:hypothetical protein [Pseudourostyla cristata]